jgi:predicted transcriptional regulator
VTPTDDAGFGFTPADRTISSKVFIKQKHEIKIALKIMQVNELIHPCRTGPVTMPANGKLMWP